MKITFLGGIIPKDDYTWFTENSIASIPFSTDTHQKSIIQGLKAHADTEVLYMSPCGFFPTRFKKPFVSEKRIDKDTLRIRSSNVPLLRLPYNIYYQICALKDAINNGTEAIICYMPFYHRMKAIYSIKKHYPNIPIVIVVPDLVEHSYSRKGIGIRRYFVRTLRRLESEKIEKLSSDIDGFVYLAEKMKEKFGKGKPYIIQEAIYNIDSVPSILQNVKDDQCIFTYCGKLAKTNGIERLIDAFSGINNSDARLYLCGDGELLDYVKMRAKSDGRITVFGQVSHDKVIEIEQRSTVLVNPRYTAIENAAFSFPSKLIEYLACGKPVITSHLAGIPTDYDSHVFYILNDSSEELRKTMELVMSRSKSELREIGKANAEFVINEKSSYAQGKKLVEFIQELGNEQQ